MEMVSRLGRGREGTQGIRALKCLRIPDKAEKHSKAIELRELSRVLGCFHL